jgi:hypothetical protein
MKVIEKIKQTKSMKDNYIIKSKKVQQLVEELNCKEHTTDGKTQVFYTDGQKKVQGQMIDIALYATKTKDGKWWVRAN